MEEAMELRDGRARGSTAATPARRPLVMPAAATTAPANTPATTPTPGRARRRSRRARIVRLPVVAQGAPGSSLSPGPTGESEGAPLVPFPHLAPLPDPNATTDTAQPHILIVEDDARTARVLRQVLEVEGDPGWAIDVVSAGAAAIAAALQTPPRVVLLDIGLPDLDGTEVYRRLRANARTAEAHVIFLTGATSHDLSARGITGGVLLRKPFATRDLASIVRALLHA